MEVSGGRRARVVLAGALLVVSLTQVRTLASVALANFANLNASHALLNHVAAGTQEASVWHTAAERALAFRPNASAVLALARGYQANGQLNAAAHAYEQALGMRESDAAWFVLGRIYEQAGDDAAARHALQRSQAQVYFQRVGLAYWSGNDFENGIKILKRGQQIYPDSELITFELARAYDAQGDSRRALEQYELSSHLPGPFVCTSLLRAAQFYMQQQQWAPAAGHVQECIDWSQATGSERASAYEGLARIALYRDGDRRQALALVERALTADPAHKEALTRLGELSLDAGQYQAATDAFGKALESNIHDAYVLAMLGVSWAHLTHQCDDSTSGVDTAARQMLGGQLDAAHAGQLFKDAYERCRPNEYFLRAWVFSFGWSGDTSGERAALTYVLSQNRFAFWAIEAQRTLR